jgi:PAS domain S-box-containing protein
VTWDDGDAVDALADGVVIFDRDGTVQLVNRAAEQMFGVDREACVGKHFEDAFSLTSNDGRTWTEVNCPFEGPRIRTGVPEQSWISPSGQEVLVTARIHRAPGHGPVTDVAVSLRSGRARARLDRDRSDLVATVAHELRSPLTGIKGFTSTLLTKWDRFSDDQRQLMLETVDADADRLSRLITELLDAARIDAGRLTLRRGPVKLDELVRRVLRNMSGGAGEPFEVTIGEGLDVIWGDSDRIIQVVTNLVENALRHGFGLKQVLVQNTDDPDGVTLEVHDNGPGIPEEMRQRVFSRFWRSGPGAGSGLGMYIARGIVEQHGGRIDILDSDGGGALLSVWFPINEPEALTD